MTAAAARAAQESGADLIGFVFASSRRQISVPAARAIAAAVKGIGKVGVFVNAPVAVVRQTARECRLDYVQLHGNETPAYCRKTGLPVIKAVRVGADSDVRLAEYDVEYFLFDSFIPGQAGGTGKNFDWPGFAPIKQAINRPYFVAGGLTPKNVGTAIKLLTPAGVDVSGGVETDGVKDAEKIRLFIENARTAGGAAHAV